MAAASRCTLNRLAGAWDAPPLNRIAVTIKVLLRYIFVILLLAVKYMACKLLTDAASRERVAGARGAPPINRIEVSIKVL